MSTRWQPEDAAGYLRYVDEVRMLRSREVWKLDLSWLTQSGVPIPAELQPYCV